MNESRKGDRYYFFFVLVFEVVLRAVVFFAAGFFFAAVFFFAAIDPSLDPVVCLATAKSGARVSWIV